MNITELTEQDLLILNMLLENKIEYLESYTKDTGENLGSKPEDITDKLYSLTEYRATLDNLNTIMYQRGLI